MSDLAVDEDVDMSERGHHAGNFWWHLYHATRRTLFCGYTNVLLVFVPIGIAAGTLGWPAEAVFVLNFLAIIPLAPLIAFLMDDLWPGAGQGHTSAELIKGTSGNAVETLVRSLSPVLF
jgi:Ca2+:H+ antiporter